MMVPARGAKSAKPNALGTNSPPGGGDKKKWIEGRCVGKEGSNEDGWMSESNETRNEVVEQKSRKARHETSGLDGAIIEEQWWRAAEMERLSLHTFLSGAFMCTCRKTKQKKSNKDP